MHLPSLVKWENYKQNIGNYTEKESKDNTKKRNKMGKLLLNKWRGHWKKGTNKLKEHIETSLIRFDSHRVVSIRRAHFPLIDKDLDESRNVSIKRVYFSLAGNRCYIHYKETVHINLIKSVAYSPKRNRTAQVNFCKRLADGSMTGHCD